MWQKGCNGPVRLMQSSEGVGLRIEKIGRGPRDRRRLLSSQGAEVLSVWSPMEMIKGALLGLEEVHVNRVPFYLFDF